MSWTLRKWIGLVAICVLWSGACSQQVERSSCTSPVLWGVHQDLGYEREASAVDDAVRTASSELHAQISRNSLAWNIVEPVEEERDWSSYDRIVARLRDRDIATLFVLIGSPAWANGRPGEEGDQFYVPTDEPAFAEWVERYARFASEAARRYHDVRWEVWNEPNDDAFWKPSPNPDRYARLFVAVREAIRQSDPQAQVATGGVNNLTVTGPNDVTGMSFLDRVRASGVRLDVVGVHPYPSGDAAPTARDPGQNNLDDVSALERWLTEIGEQSRLWITELGWDHQRIGRDLQATYLKQALERIQSRYPRVDIVIVFIDRDRPQYPFGLLTADGQLTPAGTAFAEIASAQSGCELSSS
jgi:hypothetical protein